MVPPPDYILISFDVVGLFPNILLHSTTEYIIDQLQEAHVPEDIMNDFIRLLDICTETNICTLDRCGIQIR